MRVYFPIVSCGQLLVRSIPTLVRHCVLSSIPQGDFYVKHQNISMCRRSFLHRVHFCGDWVVKNCRKYSRFLTMIWKVQISVPCHWCLKPICLGGWGGGGGQHIDLTTKQVKFCMVACCPCDVFYCILWTMWMVSRLIVWLIGLPSSQTRWRILLFWCVLWPPHPRWGMLFKRIFFLKADRYLFWRAVYCTPHEKMSLRSTAVADKGESGREN